MIGLDGVLGRNGVSCFYMARKPKAPQGWAARPAIIVDTREQTPLDFRWTEAEVVVTGLPTGDYSLVGYESLIAVERKSLSDLYGCIGRERERFERELVRLEEIARKPNGYACVVVEATMAQVAAGLDISLVSGKAAIGSCLTWSLRHGVPFHFCGDSRHAASATAKILEKWFDERIKPGLEVSDILPEAD